MANYGEDTKFTKQRATARDDHLPKGADTSLQRGSGEACQRSRETGEAGADRRSRWSGTAAAACGFHGPRSPAFGSARIG